LLANKAPVWTRGKWGAEAGKWSFGARISLNKNPRRQDKKDHWVIGTV